MTDQWKDLASKYDALQVSAPQEQAATAAPSASSPAKQIMVQEPQEQQTFGQEVMGGLASGPINAYLGLKQRFGTLTPAEQEIVRMNRAAEKAAPFSAFLSNVGTAAPAMILPGANTVLGSAVIGGLTGAAQPTIDGESALQNTAIGTAAGGVGAGIARALGSATRPRVGNDQRLLTDSGIGLTPGQNAGGVAKAIEDKATSLPIVGDIINSSRQRGIEDFNAAAIDRARLPGSTAPRVGRDALAGIRQELGAAYDAVLNRSQVDLNDQQFAAAINNLRQMAQALPAQEQRAFDEILNREIGSRMAPNGVLSGENLQMAKSGLGQRADRFGTSTDAYQRDLGDAIRQAREELQDLVRRSNPQNATELQAIDRAYANFKRLQRAASSVAAPNGVFTPAQLVNAVKAMDKSKDKRAFSEGTALLQDLAEAGKNVLPSKVPDSGTAGRLMSNVFSLGGLTSLAGGLAGAIPAYLAYSRPGAAAINATVNNIVKPGISGAMGAAAFRPALTGAATTGGTLTLADLLSQ